MRWSSLLFALIVLLIIVIVGNWVFQYSHHSVSQDITTRQDYRAALSDASSSIWSEPLACLAGLTVLAWLLAVAKVFRRSSVTRNLLAGALVGLLVFWCYLNVMDSEIKRIDVTFVLSPSVVIDCCYWALGGTLFALAIWIIVERVYVKFGIAPKA